MKKTNLIKLTKEGFERIDLLLNNFMVDKYHKTLLTGIKDRALKKNLSKSDCEVFEIISKHYFRSFRRE
jgi:hypothetical protein